MWGRLMRCINALMMLLTHGRVGAALAPDGRLPAATAPLCGAERPHTPRRSCHHYTVLMDEHCEPRVDDPGADAVRNPMTPTGSPSG